MASKNALNSKKKKAATSTAIDRYLFYYNLIQCLGWLYIFSSVIYYYASDQRKTKRIWDYTRVPVIICQLASLLEIAHAAVGFIRSSLLITVFQILFRLINVFGVLEIMPPDMDSIGVTMTLTAWSLAEIVRYSFYLVKENIPYVLLWLRYTSFLALIPLGVSGEIINVLTVQSYVAQHEKYNFVVPFVNVTLSYRLVCLSFIPLLINGCIRIFSYMFAQRRKALKSSSSSAN